MKKTKRPPLTVISGGREKRFVGQNASQKTQPALSAQDDEWVSPQERDRLKAERAYAIHGERLISTFIEPILGRTMGYLVELPDGEQVVDWLYPLYTDKKRIERFAPRPVRTEGVYRGNPHHTWLRHFYKRKV